MKRALAPSWLLAAVVLASNARANEPAPPAVEAAAEAALSRGVELRKEGKDAAALDEFRRAYEILPSPRARAQIGLAELALGRWVDAEAHLSEALRARDDPWIAKQSEPLEKSLAIAQPHLGWLEIDANVPGAEVFLNGVRVATLPMASAARVVAGSVVVSVRAPGYVEIKRPVDVAAGTRTHESVTLVAAQGDAGTVVVPPPHETVPAVGHGGSTLRALGWVALGVGVVGVGIGTYFGVRTFSDKSDRDAHCLPAGCDPAGLGFDHDARRDATVSTVSFSVGIAGAVAGAILLWRAGASTTATGAAKGLRFIPSVGQNGAMAFAEGSF